MPRCAGPLLPRALAPLLVLFLVWGAVTPLPDAAADEAAAKAEAAYRKALARYEDRIDRPPIATRLGGIRALAATRDPRALQVLGARYARPRVPKDHERYLLAASIGDRFTGAEHVAALGKLRRKYRKDEHAWLWFHAARAAARGADVAGLLETVRNAKTKPFLRAAVLERLAAERRREALSYVAQLGPETLPRKGVARTLLLETAASLLLALRDDASAPGYPESARAVVDLLALEEVRERTKLVIARHLAQTFRVDKVTTDHAFWRRMLAALEPVETGGETVAGRPRFFGLEAAGKRVVYVIDLSDSMLDPLTYREKRDAKRLDPEGISWPRVHNRFELARAYLKQSIEGLPDDVRFMVIGFGTHAEPFRATKKLMKASRGNTTAALKELADIEPGRVAKNRPYGTLRGATNLHGALLRAFQATTNKPIDQHEHVDAKGLTEGCDTIFVFGDGRPNEDDFAATDRHSGGRVVTDTETGKTAPATPGSARFYGPYRNVGNLLQDVRRMNLFRRAEIHTVAMGEADNALMRRLAEIGLGRYRSIGFLGREGRVNAWWLMGPYAAKDAKAWERKEAPEDEVALAAPLTLEGKPVYWRRVFTSHKAGFVNLDREMEPRNAVFAYAFARIFVEEPVEARLVMGSDDGLRIWLNDAVVHTAFETRGWEADSDKVDVTLAKGWNRLLVKCCDGKGKWGFSVRITDREDEPLDFRME